MIIKMIKYCQVLLNFNKLIYELIKNISQMIIEES